MFTHRTSRCSANTPTLVNVQKCEEQNFGTEGIGEPPHPQGGRARTHQFSLTREAQSQDWFTESTPFITELHFHLHTNYFKELEQV